MGNSEQYLPDSTIVQQKNTSFGDAVNHAFYDLSYTFNPLFREGVLAREQLRDDLSFIYDNYGIRVQMGKQTDQDITNYVIPSKLNLFEAVPMVQIIREEITKYPLVYIQHYDIERFRLVKELKNLRSKEDVETVGLAIEDSKQVYVGFNNDLKFFRQTFHHEVFHRGDQVMMEQAKRLPQPYQHPATLKVTFFNRDWANLNPTGEYAYFYNRYKPRKGQLNYEPIKGFAVRYGKMDEMEDRATIAEYLMTDPQTLFKRATNDAVLRKKINKIIQIFSERSNGIMNLDYFQALAQQ
jgi:hypothetical protein